MAEKTGRIDQGGETGVVGEAGADEFAADVAAAGGDRVGPANPGPVASDPDGGGTGVGDLAGGTGIGTDDAGGDSGEAVGRT